MEKVVITVTAAGVEKEKFIQIGTVAEFIRNIAKTDDINTFTEMLDNIYHMAKKKDEDTEKFCFKSYCFIDGPERMLPENKIRSIGQRDIWSTNDDGMGLKKASKLEVFQYQGKSWVRAADFEKSIFE